MCPIRGMSDRGLGFPEIGTVRKGAAKTENRPGKDLSYFRVIFDERELKAAETFKTIYGEQPTWFRIVLPFDEIERMWDPFMEAYTAGRMVARADGEYFLYLLDAETGDVLVKNGIDLKTGQPRPYLDDRPVGYYTDSKGKKQPIKCKPNGRLKVIIPELARAAYMTVLTTSIHDIINISDQLRAFKTLNNGRLSGIPFIIRRRPRSISVPKPDGQRVRMVKWLISIEADPEWVKAALQEAKRLALPGNGLALPEPNQPEFEEPIEDDMQTDFDEDEIIEGDFGDTEQTSSNDPVLNVKAAPDMNGKGRPYAPDVLRAKLRERGLQYTGQPTDKQIGLIAMLIEKAFAGKDNSKELRHDVQFYLFGHESLKDAEPGILLAALNNWLSPTQDAGGDYNPDPMAAKEIVRVQTEALIAEGQAQLI